MTTRLGPFLAGAALLVSACAIPVGEPEALPQEGREDLLEGTSTTATTLVDASEAALIRLFFIGPDDKLETIERPYPDGVEINTVLKDLGEQPPQPTEQPTDDEEIGLLRSLVPEDLNATLQPETPAEEVRGVRILQVASEALLREQLAESPIQGRLIVSQVVCTFLRMAPDGTVGVELHDDQGELPLTDDAAQPVAGAATEENFNGCQTGTEERLELVEAGSESTTTTDPEADG